MKGQKPNSAPSTARLIDVLNAHFKLRSGMDLHFLKVASVNSYNDASRTISCHLPIKPYSYAGYTQEGQALVFEDVPVVFPHSSQAHIHIPLVAGDLVLLFCADDDINTALANSLKGGQIDSSMTHEMRTVFAVAGIVPRANGEPTAAFPEGSDPAFVSATNLKILASLELLLQGLTGIKLNGGSGNIEATTSANIALVSGGTVAITGAGGGLGTALTALIALLKTLHPAQASAFDSINSQIRSILQ